MAMTSFDFDERTLAAIDALKTSFGVKTNAAVVRRALALACLVADQADDKNSVVLVGRDETVKLSLAG
jgi:hypothetical protein